MLGSRRQELRFPRIDIRQRGETVDPLRAGRRQHLHGFGGWDQPVARNSTVTLPQAASSEHVRQCRKPTAIAVIHADDDESFGQQPGDTQLAERVGVNEQFYSTAATVGYTA